MSGPLAGKRIGLLSASASRQGGGVFEAVAAQAGMVRSLGGEALVFALDDPDFAEDRARFAPGTAQTFPVLGPRQIGFAPRLLPALLAAGLDCLHLHGIWMYPSHAGASWAAQTGKPYVISPHGMLDPWITGRGKWKKALARLGYERRSWAAARVFHALTGRESEDIARESGRRECLVIPNAGPEPGEPPTAVRAPEVLYLGRIHAKKNLAALLAAWRNLAAGGALPEGARLTLAGWGDDEAVAELRAALTGAPPSVRFVGPVYGADKAALLAQARFLVLPSLSEGLPMVALEAWAAGTPALLSSECNLPEGYAAGAALDCGMTHSSIGDALGTALTLPAERWLDMARVAQGLAVGPFSPAAIAARWGGAYAALMEPPAA